MKKFKPGASIILLTNDGASEGSLEVVFIVASSSSSDSESDI